MEEALNNLGEAMKEFARKIEEYFESIYYNKYIKYKKYQKRVKNRKILYAKRKAKYGR